MNVLGLCDFWKLHQHITILKLWAFRKNSTSKVVNITKGGRSFVLFYTVNDPIWRQQEQPTSLSLRNHLHLSSLTVLFAYKRTHMPPSCLDLHKNILNLTYFASRPVFSICEKHDFEYQVLVISLHIPGEYQCLSGSYGPFTSTSLYFFHFQCIIFSY